MWKTKRGLQHWTYLSGHEWKRPFCNHSDVLAVLTFPPRVANVSKAQRRKMHDTCAGMSRYVCVFFTQSCFSLYSSTSSTPPVRVDASSQRYTSRVVTKLRHRDLTSWCCKGSSTQRNALPPYRIRYVLKYNIRTPATQMGHDKRTKYTRRAQAGLQ